MDSSFRNVLLGSHPVLDMLRDDLGQYCQDELVQTSRFTGCTDVGRQRSEDADEQVVDVRQEGLVSRRDGRVPRVDVALECRL